MFHKSHKNNAHAPVGLLLGKVVLALAGALLNRKLEERRAARQEPVGLNRKANDGRSARPA